MPAQKEGWVIDLLEWSRDQDDALADRILASNSLSDHHADLRTATPQPFPCTVHVYRKGLREVSVVFEYVRGQGLVGHWLREPSAPNIVGPARADNDLSGPAE